MKTQVKKPETHLQKVSCKSTTGMVTLAMFCAISVVLVYLIHFPIFPAAAFLEYDPADIPIFILTFLFGPEIGLIATAVVSVLQWLLVSQASGWIGCVMHIVSTGGFVLVAGLIYKKHRTLKGAVVSLAFGILTMTVTMVLWNIIFTPIYMGAPLEAVLDIMLPCIIPFNLIKAGVNSILAFLLYKSVGNVVKRILIK